MPNIVRIRNLVKETNLSGVTFPIDKQTYTENAKRIDMSDLKEYILSGFTGGGGSTGGTSGTSGIDGVDGIDGIDGTSGISPCVQSPSNSITIVFVSTTTTTTTSPGTTTTTTTAAPTTYYNTYRYSTYYKTGCPGGTTADPYIVDVLAFTYSSLISVNDANNQADAWISANGQSLADIYGNCSAVSTYYNTYRSDIYYKNNCPGGTTPDPYTVFVLANTYSSLISVADANSQADAWIAANGQAQANANGTCTTQTVYYNTYQSDGSYLKNDCASGYVPNPNPYYVVVPYGTFTSLISVTDANNQALAWIAANGQNEANANSTCDFVYYNIYRSGVYYKNNCTSPSTPDPYTVFVVANTYSSLISVADANSQADAWISANGQALANANGTCTYPCNSYCVTYNFNTGEDYNYTDCFGAPATEFAFANAESRTISASVAPSQTHFNVVPGSCTPTTTTTTTTTTTVTPYWYILSACAGGTYYYGPTTDFPQISTGNKVEGATSVFYHVAGTTTSNPGSSISGITDLGLGSC